jgi:hypothetical protein
VEFVHKFVPKHMVPVGLGFLIASFLLALLDIRFGVIIIALLTIIFSIVCSIQMHDEEKRKL